MSQRELGSSSFSGRSESVPASLGADNILVCALFVVQLMKYPGDGPEGRDSAKEGVDKAWTRMFMRTARSGAASTQNGDRAEPATAPRFECAKSMMMRQRADAERAGTIYFGCGAGARFGSTLGCAAAVAWDTGATCGAGSTSSTAQWE
jgi:hypothetical protein